jgi:hypothetical protein
MNIKQFIQTCVGCGYASKKNAMAYAEGKTEFTDNDFIAVHEINEHHLFLKNRFLINGSCEAEHLLNDLNRRPTPWNRIFDSCKGLEKEE